MTGAEFVESLRRQGVSEGCVEMLEEVVAEIIRKGLVLQGRFGPPVGPCPCACNSGGFCGGCGHAGCGGRR